MPVRHAFVFRHCVRSTGAKVNLYEEDDDGGGGTTNTSSSYSTDPADYIDIPLPNWQTAPMWCTLVGSEIVQATGQYLMEEYLPQFGATKKIRVHFVSDVSRRDLDTAWSLAEGMAAAVRKSNTIAVADGLNSLETDAALFNPTKTTWDTDQTLCVPVVAKTKNRYLSERFGTIEKPGPVEDAIDIIEKYGGVGVMGSLRDLPPTRVNAVNAKLAGRINAIKYMAEAALYSTLSDIPFFTNITKSELLDLVAWIHYERSVSDVGNNDAALHGGVLVDRVLNVLSASADADDSEYDQMATFFVGHDGDLDNIATALGLTWKVEPYVSGKDGVYMPTPPNTGLHFSYDTDGDDESVSISVLTPIYFSQNGTSGDDESLSIVKTGILEERPVQFTNFGTTTITTKNGRTIFGTMDPQTNAVNSIRNYVEGQLKVYEGAMDCYDKVKATSTPAPSATGATAASTLAPTMAKPGQSNTTLNPVQTSYPVPSPPHPSLPHTLAPSIAYPMPSKSSSAKGQVFGVWIIFIVMAAGLVALIRSVGRTRRQGRSATYSEMGDVRHDLGFELT